MAEKELLKDFQLKIGEVVLGITLSNKPEEREGFQISPDHQRFLTEDEPEAFYKVHYGKIPSFNPKEKVFESGGVWSLYRENGQFILPLVSPAFGPKPYKVAFLEPDFLKGEIYASFNSSSNQLSYPLEYPLDEVLMVNLLSQGRGIELHACGIVTQGKGFIFTGTSGAGKSTLANLFKTEPKITILSDDRVIVRKKEGRFILYGTPWHGDARVCSPNMAPLERIYFIKHAKNNHLKPLKKSDIVSSLLVRCFPTFWNSKGMEYTLELCNELSQEVPAYELGFLPDKSILDFLDSLVCSVGF